MLLLTSSSTSRARRGPDFRRLIAVAGLAALAALTAGCGISVPSARSPGGATGSSGTGTGGQVNPSPSSTASGSVPGEQPATGQRSGVVGGALFGSDAPLAHEESQLGRNMAIVRVYRKVGQTFPDAQEKQFMSTGSTLLVSLDTFPPGPTYATIAAGKDDGVIGRFLKQVDQAAGQYHLGAIYICFEHEANVPAQHNGLGSPAEFVKAWDHVRQLAVSAHLDWNQGGRLHWVWILAHRAFFTNRPKSAQGNSASAYWPGSGEVDIVAADGYNDGGGTGQSCQKAPKTKGSGYVEQGTQTQSPASIFGPLLAFAKAQGNLPVFIAEWGTISYASPAVQPDYIRQMQAYVTANPEIAAAEYWNGRPPHGPCDYAVVGHPASMSALAAMGHSSRMQGHLI